MSVRCTTDVPTIDRKYEVSFPKAYGAHAGCNVEWHYFTGLLRDDDEHRISFFFTLFRTAAMTFPVLHLLDLETGKVLLHAEGLVEGAPLELEEGIWVVAHGESGTLGLQHLGQGRYRIEARLPGRHVEFRMDTDPTSAPVLHGNEGLVHQSTNGPSAYYTIPASGGAATLRIGSEPHALRGEVWHDHQWGDFAYGPDGFDEACFLYDWFSCRFDDGSKLVVYRFRDRSGQELPGRQIATHIDADGKGRVLERIRFTRGAERFSPARYPGEAYTTAWELEVPELGFRIALRAARADQLIEQASTGEHYYSGVFWIEGDRRGYAFGEFGLPGTSQGASDPITERPLLSHRGLRKSLPILDTFVRGYFPFYGLETRDFFAHGPTLTFIESTIYQLDHFLEQAQQSGEADTAEAFELVRRHLGELLVELGVHDEEIAFELQEMTEYCELEMRLMTPGEMPTEADLLRAIELRTIDLRILHRVLCRLLGIEYDEGFFDFVRPVEALWDIEEDLDQYADDVREDSFNILRMYARVYGSEAPARLRATIERLRAEVQRRLPSLPADMQRTAHAVYRSYRASKAETPIPALISDNEAVPEAENEAPPRPAVRPGHGWADGGPPRLWPSVGEYPAYDDFAYGLMEGDDVRNRLYQRAVEALAPGAVALDIGTGRSLLWARACLRAGARHVYAIEEMPETFEQAQQTIREHGLGDSITLLRGRSDELELPERVDLCVSEIIGCIGSSEGAGAVLEDARRRHLRPGGSMIPARCQTWIAPATLPDALHPRPRFEPAASDYARRIFDACGGPFDVRVLVENLRAEHLLGPGEVFEDLDFELGVAASETRQLGLGIARGGRLDGFALWVRLWCERGGDHLDALRDEVSWVPVFIPALYPGVSVREGDRVELQGGRRCSADGAHPDYHLRGTLHTTQGPRDFSSASPYLGASFRGSSFYRELFGSWS